MIPNVPQALFNLNTEEQRMLKGDQKSVYELIIKKSYECINMKRKKHRLNELIADRQSEKIANDLLNRVVTWDQVAQEGIVPGSEVNMATFEFRGVGEGGDRELQRGLEAIVSWLETHEGKRELLDQKYNYIALSAESTQDNYHVCAILSYKDLVVNNLYLLEDGYFLTGKMEIANYTPLAATFRIRGREAPIVGPDRIKFILGKSKEFGVIASCRYLGQNSVDPTSITEINIYSKKGPKEKYTGSGAYQLPRGAVLSLTIPCPQFSTKGGQQTNSTIVMKNKLSDSLRNFRLGGTVRGEDASASNTGGWGSYATSDANRASTNGGPTNGIGSTKNIQNSPPIHQSNRGGEAMDFTSMFKDKKGGIPPPNLSRSTTTRNASSSNANTRYGRNRTSTTLGGNNRTSNARGFRGTSTRPPLSTIRESANEGRSTSHEHNANVRESQYEVPMDMLSPIQGGGNNFWNNRGDDPFREPAVRRTPWDYAPPAIGAPTNFFNINSIPRSGIFNEGNTSTNIFNMNKGGENPCRPPQLRKQGSIFPKTPTTIFDKARMNSIFPREQQGSTLSSQLFGVQRARIPQYTMSNTLPQQINPYISHQPPHPYIHREHPHPYIQDPHTYIQDPHTYIHQEPPHPYIPPQQAPPAPPQPPAPTRYQLPRGMRRSVHFPETPSLPKELSLGDFQQIATGRESELQSKLHHMLQDRYLTNATGNTTTNINIEQKITFNELYSDKRSGDIRIQTQGEYVYGHRIVLCKSSQFINRTLQKECIVGAIAQRDTLTIKIHPWVKLFPLQLAVKYFYMGDLGSESTHMGIQDYRELLLVAKYLEATHLQRELIIKYIVPILTPEVSIQLLKDGFNDLGHNPQQSMREYGVITPPVADVWNLLKNVAFAKIYGDSQIVLRTLKYEILGMSPNLLAQLVSNSLFLIREKEEIYPWLNLFEESKYYLNMFDLLIKTSANFEHMTEFNQQNIDLGIHLGGSLYNGQQPIELMIILDDLPVSVNTITTTVDSAPAQPQAVPQQMNPSENYACSTIKEIMDRIDYVFTFPMILEKERDKVLPPHLSGIQNRTVLSNIFTSQTHQWLLKVDIHNTGDVSVWLVEAGSRKCELGTQGIADTIDRSPLVFKSVIFEITLDDGDHRKSFCIFYSFAEEERQIIGNRKFFNTQALSDHNSIILKVKILEYSIHSALMQYLAENFESHMEKSFNFRVNPGASLGATPSHIRIEGESRRSRDDLSGYMGIGTGATYPGAQEQPRRSISMGRRVEPRGRDIGRGGGGGGGVGVGVPDGYKNKGGVRITEEKRREQLAKEIQNLIYIYPFDLNFLFASNHLDTPNESLVFNMLQGYARHHYIKQIDPLIRGIRFQFVATSDILNVARDNLVIRNSPIFKYKVHQTLANRASPNYTLTEKPRISYRAVVTAKPLFFNEITDWIVNEDHHRGYSSKVTQLRGIIKDERQINKDKEEKWMSQKRGLEELVNEADRKRRKVEADNVDEKRKQRLIENQIVQIQPPHPPKDLHRPVAFDDSTRAPPPARGSPLCPNAPIADRNPRNRSPTQPNNDASCIIF